MSSLRQLFRHPGFHFALFVFWLLSLPMGGPLLQLFPGAEIPALFLLPHLLTLFLLCQVSTIWRGKIDFFAIIICALCTLLPLFQLTALFLLPLMGICSAIICLRICQRLVQTNVPALAAALGLGSANLMLYLVANLPITQNIHLIAATLAISATYAANSADSARDKAPHITAYLICLVIFHIVSGIMYEHVLPHHDLISFAPGSELIFYLLAVLCAYQMLRFGHDILLIMAIGSGILALAMLAEAKPVYFLLSMFSLQAAAGFADMFVLVLIIRCGGGAKTTGYVLGAVCAGILFGQYLSQQADTTLPGVVVIGNLSLSLTLISFYLLKKRKRHTVHNPTQLTTEQNIPSQPAKDKETSLIPEQLSAILSDRETFVLERVIRGETYRDIADQLKITESTIKTYMRRIREKTGTTNKRELLQQLNQK